MFGAGLVAAWLAALLLLGVVVGGRKGRAIADRLGESLHGEATVDGSELALIRGRLEVDGLRVRRDGPTGTLALDVGELRCELPPLGLALFDGACRELALDGFALDVSSFDVLRVPRPRHEPIHAGAVAIAGAVLKFPIAGGRGEVRLDARAAATTFKTPLSWVLALDALRATLVLPQGTIEVAYRGGVLVVSGGLFTEPIALAVVPPRAAPDDDATAELRRIVGWGRGVVAELMKRQLDHVLRRARQPR